ncbi:hypothetical protein MPLSOD_110129 [Mesorhizobium sp. SOD10]|nr:hypothetical protein MPLSOD_110129 [Mesorhizobium sp. SOD10]
MSDQDRQFLTDRLKGRLEILLRKTESAKDLPAGYWGFGKAVERQISDDWSAGRIFWRAAWENARHGLDSIAVGDLDMADVYVWQATDAYIAALESRLQHRPSDVAVLTRPASRRGRPKKN